MEPASRQKWSEQSSRRRKQPSLYDEYLNQERSAMTQSHPVPQSIIQPTPEVREQHFPQPRSARSDNTIRTVTPDSVVEETTINMEGHVLGSSPRTSLKRDRDSPRSLLLGRSESTDNTRNRMQYTSTTARRNRTRTLDESASRDVSPGTALHPGSRLRHGSIHLTGSETSVSGALPNSSARRILHLMKTLCGRMSGTLWFRRGPSATWLQSYCYIQEDTGSLLCEADVNNSQNRTLIPDLRGCQVRTAMDEDTQMPYLDISVPNSTLQLHVRLKDRKDFDSWFAALLCWQPIRPRGIHNKMTKPQTPVVQGITLTDSRRNSEMSLTLKEAPIIKVGPMIYWDSNISYTNAGTPRSLKPSPSRFQSYGSHWWRRVSCTLRENGELKLYAESGSTLLSVVQLSQLSRSAVQRLDPSVLDNDFCIAIYPQYTSGATVTTAIRPIYLSMETRVLYEVWFVLLRAFTIPQLYGPKPNGHSDESAFVPDTPSSSAFDNMMANEKIEMFRMERALSIRIIEAKLPHAPLSSLAEFNHHHSNRHNNNNNAANKPELSDGYYVEIHLDGETRGKTQIKHESMAPFWREEFDYLDLPAVLTSASVLLKRRPPDLSSPREQHELRLVHEAYGLLDPSQKTGGSAGFMPVQNDQTLGKVEIFLEELEASKEVEKWWPVMNQHGENVGEILIKARAEENVILMAKDYKPLNDLLHNFSNELTLQVAQMIPTELRRLSDLLLNIFQVSGQVTEWIMALVEEEIDGVHKETPVSRMRYNRRVANSNNETDLNVTAASERELMVRDMNKNATLEANLLFRGNTLLTKSLDSHMRRVGKEYLLECLGPIIRDINEKDPDCEVDPNRVTNQHDLKKNWDRLINCTKSVWNVIKVSARNAPSELRVIFRHIRACAEDRYGDFLRSVSYSSVSGFLFLRFFCPAVLNPKLFGLLKDDPKPRARRTFTLIAKSLQGLANMASFGSKEHWMEPMNVFLTDHREAFKTFINDICSISAPDGMIGQKPPSYSTPLAIQSRLPMTSREGFPSLPYLIDQSREIASLVELWLHGTTNGSEAELLAAQIGKEDGDLLTFHRLCRTLDAQTKECLSRAERAERPNSALSFRWEELIDQLQNTSLLENGARIDDALDVPTRDSFEDVTSQAAQLDPTRGRGFSVGGVGLGRYSGDTESQPPTSWEEDRDGGAQAAAVSILSQDNNRFDKPSFDIPRPGTSTASVSASGSYSNNIGAAFMREGSAQLPRDLTSASLNLHFPRGDRERKSKEREREGSMSGSVVSSETDATTALPSLARERERREREKERKEKAKREERERRLKDFIPGLTGLRRKNEQKDKDKDKDRE
ncbi:Rho GTPase activation protein [Aureobasidium pullulans]|uniref:Rho GTPase activation protein n=1 Tax=Aureobasidium pullulans TaxID=5580 RepID=A0A4S8YCF2_AURPU|nr:Rho GTPase activation protein [Aureobasidium pullulans]